MHMDFQVHDILMEGHVISCAFFNFSLPNPDLPPFSSLIMAIQPLTLQLIFEDTAETFRQLQTLDLIEGLLSDISDFLDDQRYGAGQIVEDMRPMLTRLRRQLKFLAAMQMLQAARRLQQHLTAHHRLPMLDLNF